MQRGASRVLVSEGGACRGHLQAAPEAATGTMSTADWLRPDWLGGRPAAGTTYVALGPHLGLQRLGTVTLRGRSRAARRCRRTEAPEKRATCAALRTQKCAMRSLGRPRTCRAASIRWISFTFGCAVHPKSRRAEPKVCDARRLPGLDALGNQNPLDVLHFQAYLTPLGPQAKTS